MDSSDQTTWRILDANFNRAREALRVIEEYTRFCLDDAGITETVKVARHRLGSAITGLQSRTSTGSCNDAAQRLAARDIVGDIGRKLTTSTEFARSGTGHVVLASCKRLSEALRALEEYGKVIDGSFAAEMERLRYEAYEIERRVALTARARDRFGRARLYVLITERLCVNDWWATAQAALSGGADVLQLREPDLPDRELLDRAKRLAGLCREHSALLIINNRADIAAAGGADGVHLGQGDMPVAAARRLLPGGLIGLSTHTLEQIEGGIRALPDYLAVGPIFPSATKSQDHIAGPGTLAAARSRTSLPLAAIGGINAGNVSEVLAAAECCVCVCQAVIGQADVAQAASQLKAATTNKEEARLNFR